MSDEKAEMTQSVNDGGELCQRCGEKGEDRRTLWMACFYEMMELGIPFDRAVLLHAPDITQLTVKAKPIQFTVKDGHLLNVQSGTVVTAQELTPKNLYTLRVCKDCRGDWLAAIKKWFEAEVSRESCGSGIFVRRNGRNVEITEEEWYRDNPGREPVRVK